MSSKFLSGGQTDFTDGTAQINIKSATIQDLLPNLPVRTTTGKLLTSGLIQVTDCAFVPLSDPFNGTLHVENIETAYNTTPVDLNAFIASTLTDLSTLQSNTQYITATPGLTTIASNLSTFDVKASQYQDPTGSTFIDMSSPGDISVSATTFDFNGNPILTSADLAGYLKLDGTSTMVGDLNLGSQNIINTGTLTPSANNTEDIGSFLDSYKDIYLAGSIQGSSLTTSANSIVSGPGSAVVNNIPVFSNVSGKAIGDSLVPISSLSGGPFMPISGGTFTGPIQMGTQILTVNNMSDNGTNGMHWGAGSSATNIDGLTIGRNSGSSNDSLIVGRNSSSAGQYGVMLGVNNNGTDASAGNVAVGTFSNVSGGGAIAIGFTVDATAAGAIAIGTGIANPTADSLLIGSVNPFVNWRPGTSGTCDLGTSSNRFKDVYANSVISPSSTVQIDDIFLRTGTVAMTGNINVGAQEINNVAAIRPSSNNVIIGQGAVDTDIVGVAIGHNAIVNALSSTVVGSNSFADSSASFATSIGSASASFAVGGVAIGSNSLAGGTNGIAIGRNAGALAAQAVTIGFNINNSTVNSFLIGNAVGSIVNFRPNTTGTCDLGVLSTNQFNNVFANGIDSSGAVTIAPTSATSLTLGRAGITTLTNGISAMIVASGAWYSTVSFINAFTAATNRLVIPSSTLNALLSEFTNALGVLTYTGTRTRTFKIEYSITYTNAANNGMIMTFFNSKNASIVLGTSQTSVRQQGYTSTLGATAQLITTTFSDIISLATNDTVELAAASSLSLNVTFSRISCNIVGLLN